MDKMQDMIDKERAYDEAFDEIDWYELAEDKALEEEIESLKKENM